jgi:hypothetical protein
MRLSQWRTANAFGCVRHAGARRSGARRRPARWSNVYSAAEVLECRTLLSNVGLSVAGGIMTLNGDAGSHEFDVFVDVDQLVFQGAAGTQFNFLGHTNATVSIPLATIGALNALFGNFPGGGAKTIFFDGANLPPIGGPAIFNMGSGAIDMSISRLGVKGALLYNSGSGPNQLLVSDSQLGFVSVTTGNGADVLAMFNTSVDGGLVASLGGGSDVAQFAGLNGSMVVKGPVTLLTGDGDAEVDFGSSGVGSSMTIDGPLTVIGGATGAFDIGITATNAGSVTINGGVSVISLGAGGTEVLLAAVNDGSISVNGSILVSAGASNDFVGIISQIGGAHVQITGGLIAILGEGQNSVSLNSQNFGGLVIDGQVLVVTGNQSDAVSITGAVLLKSGLLVISGAGADVVELGELGGETTEIRGSVTLLLGEANGLQTASVHDVEFQGSLTILGGGGSDTVALEKTNVVGLTLIDTQGGADNVSFKRVAVLGNSTALVSTGAGASDNLRVNDSNFTGTVLASSFGANAAIQVENENTALGTTFQGMVQVLALGTGSTVTLGISGDADDFVSFLAFVTLMGPTPPINIFRSIAGVTFANPPTVFNGVVINV